MNKDEPRFSNDGKCPYCKSDRVSKIGAFGAGASSSPKFPDSNIKVWICDDCEKSFNTT